MTQLHEQEMQQARATRKYIYADESGNFDFSNNPGATEYFIMTTVLIEDHSIATELFALRRKLAWDGFGLRAGFHATEDKQRVRDAVYDILRRHSFRVDATILHKRKAQLQLRVSDMRFYQYAWFYHMRYVAPRVVSRREEILAVTASVGTKKKEAAFSAVIEEMMEQVSPTDASKSVLWTAASDPCLQVADYCSWAIQRKWETGDDRSHRLIRDKIASEYVSVQS